MKGVHANASISQVAAGWKCSLALGIYGTKGSVRWDLQQPNEIYVGRRDEPNQILQRATAGFSEDVAGFTDYPGGHPEGFADAHKMHYRAVYQHIASGRKTPTRSRSASAASPPSHSPPATTTPTSTRSRRCRPRRGPRPRSRSAIAPPPRSSPTSTGATG